MQTTRQQHWSAGISHCKLIPARSTLETVRSIPLSKCAKLRACVRVWVRCGCAKHARVRSDNLVPNPPHPTPFPYLLCKLHAENSRIARIQFSTAPAWACTKLNLHNQTHTRTRERITRFRCGRNGWTKFSNWKIFITHISCCARGMAEKFHNAHTHTHTLFSIAVADLTGVQFALCSRRLPGRRQRAVQSTPPFVWRNWLNSSGAV